MSRSAILAIILSVFLIGVGLILAAGPDDESASVTDVTPDGADVGSEPLEATGTEESVEITDCEWSPAPIGRWRIAGTGTSFESEVSSVVVNVQISTGSDLLENRVATTPDVPPGFNFIWETFSSSDVGEEIEVDCSVSRVSIVVLD